MKTTAKPAFWYYRCCCCSMRQCRLLLLVLLFVYACLMNHLYNYASEGVKVSDNGILFPPPSFHSDGPKVSNRVLYNNNLDNNNNSTINIESKSVNNKFSANIWTNSSSLPQWMKDYFSWHAQQRLLLDKDFGSNNIHSSSWCSNNSNTASIKILVMNCLRTSRHCGGTADRLKPVPFMLRLAHDTNRLLLIHWERPAALEEFLLPPLGGMDWRTPSCIVQELQSKTNLNPIKRVLELVRVAHNVSIPIVSTTLQSNDHGSQYYNNQALRDSRLNYGNNAENVNDAFRRQYRDSWRVLFTPVPAIANLITSEMQALGLVPGNYAFAHLRALYGIENTKGRDPDLIRGWTINALNCLSNIQPTGPYYFASDVALARQVALDYGMERKANIVARDVNVDSSPLHLDMDFNAQTGDSNINNNQRNQQYDASTYYDTFVDLYIMSMGCCMSYNMGGFAKWAQLLSGRDFTCNIRHWTPGVGKSTANKNGCKWTGTSTPTTQNPEQIVSSQKPLFLPPMKTNNEVK